MYIEELFDKYVEWKILKYFLDNPNEEIHLKELARRLEISSGSASTTLNKAGKDKILNKKVIGNIHLYSLNKKNEHVKRLRRVVREL